MKTSELTGRALDWAVAEAHGDMRLVPVAYSTDWAFGGPIIEREEIYLAKSILGGWTASIYTHDDTVRCTLHGGDTPLIAAMRCYCCTKLGDEIDIPEELCQQQSN